MHPSISALHELQQRDRQLTALERKLEAIPTRLQDLEDDLAKLESMLDSERNKCEETKSFQRGQEEQLVDEEELLRASRAKMNQVKSARELSATQREIESTRRMATARSEEIKKLQEGVAEAEQRIAAMSDSLVSLRAQANEEKDRLVAAQEKFGARLERLRTGRSELTSQLEKDLLRHYDRIRKRVGGVAFVAAAEGRCTACKMVIPHQIYVVLKKGDDIPACESCGRLLFFVGHFPADKGEPSKEPKPKASPPQRRSVPKD